MRPPSQSKSAAPGIVDIRPARAGDVNAVILIHTEDGLHLFSIPDLRHPGKPQGVLHFLAQFQGLLSENPMCSIIVTMSSAVRATT